MMEIKEPRFRVGVHLTIDKMSHNFSYPGEKPKELMDRYKAVLGDGKAGISVSTDFSVKSFGNGSSAMVTVSLTCGQDEQSMNAAAELAAGAARYYAAKFQAEGEVELRNQLIAKGRTPEF